MWARANRGAGPDSAADDDPSLRAHRRAPRAPRLAARPRHRYAARLGPGDVREGRVDDGIRWAGLSRRRGERHHGIRLAARRRFHAAGPGCADLRVAPAAEELPTAGGPDRRGSRGAVVRRAGGLAERLESPLPAARRRGQRGRRGRAAMTKLVAVIVAPILHPDAACAVLDRVQGLVLTGGEDVEPGRYHAPPHPKLGETDAGRDAVELALIAGARQRRLPLLAICRGIQILNVALGGTLYQDLASERRGPIDHADARACHGLSVEAGSRLHGTINAEQVTVNSRHHQAIRDLAPALRATAWAEDGLIEGVEPKDPTEPWTLAVQWHPEDDVEGALFAGFAGAVA